MTSGRGERITRVERFKRGKIKPGPLGRAFTRLATRTAALAGHHWAFVIASALIVFWFASGPLFGWSDTWQLVANTFTTLVTFVMVFLIQNTQNRDSKAIHLKLDELIRAIPEARNEFMEAEEEDLDEILREKAIVDRSDPAPPDTKEARIKEAPPREQRKAARGM